MLMRTPTRWARPKRQIPPGFIIPEGLSVEGSGAHKFDYGTKPDRVSASS